MSRTTRFYLAALAAIACFLLGIPAAAAAATPEYFTMPSGIGTEVGIAVQPDGTVRPRFGPQPVGARASQAGWEIRIGCPRAVLPAGSSSESAPVTRTNAVDVHRHASSPCHSYITPESTVPASRPSAFAM
jgi:hypothetical protein